jgi:pectate lyase
MTTGSTCDEQSETQPNILTVLEGGHVKNLRINRLAADGIHCKGNCTLENIVWEDVCEDAATMEGGPGTVMTIIGGSAANAEDKVFQHNGHGSTIRIRGFTTFNSIGRFWQSCGDCLNNGGPRYLDLDGATINGPVTSDVARVNRNFNDKATIRNLRINDYVSGRPRICTDAIGVQPGGSGQTFGEQWETAYCDVRRSDIIPF